MSETNESLDVDFGRPDILEPDESEPVDLEEVPDWDISVPEEEVEHFEEGPAPEDMEGVEVVEDE